MSVEDSTLSTIYDVEPTACSLDSSLKLSLGIFNDSCFDESFDIDNVSRHFYIWDNTMDILPDYVTYVEGIKSDYVVRLTEDWFGGGVTWDESVDLSDWVTLNVSIQSSTASFASLHLLFQSIVASETVELRIDLQEYGYLNNGLWHDIQINLEEIVGDSSFSFETVTIPFAILSESTGTIGDVMYIDRLYLSQ